jgi:hypothetical protein
MRVIIFAAAPAMAGAHHASRRNPQDEIGTSLRWCDGEFE